MVAGTGDNEVTINEGRKFIAGMMNTLLNLHDLVRLDKCVIGTKQTAYDVSSVKQAFDSV